MPCEHEIAAKAIVSNSRLLRYPHTRIHHDTKTAETTTPFYDPMLSYKNNDETPIVHPNHPLYTLSTQFLRNHNYRRGSVDDDC